MDNNTNIIPADTAKNGYCATIGFFDGVHRGHQFLIDRLAQTAHAEGRRALVITFDRHPRQVVHASYVPQLITPLAEKLRLLNATAADRVEVLRFDQTMAQMPARQFMRDILMERLDVDTLVIGYDNRFGHNRAEGFDEYVAYGHEMGMEVRRNDALDIGPWRVSSSLIRRMIANGHVEDANRCLGHRFAIEGRVSHGYAEGRKLGFPTANITPDTPEQIMPAKGVYAVSASVDGGEPMKAMMNIGDNPTFGRASTTLEAHILGFSGDIYGHTVRLEFATRLRDERRFDSADELKEQLARDMMAVESANIIAGN